MSAPFSMRHSTTSSCPSNDATCKAVQSFYKQLSIIAIQ